MLPRDAEKSALESDRHPLEPAMEVPLVEMMKTLAMLVLALVLNATPAAGAAAASGSVNHEIRELIESARNAPAPLCACAARAVQNHWGWTDAPASPLGRPVGERARNRHALSYEDVGFLLASLDTPDPCVRELAVRLVAEDDREEVENGLVRRLEAPDSSLRMVAALGLGIGAPHGAVDALMRATRDDAAGVRANAVWALGRIGDTRATGSAVTALTDHSPLVRQAAAETIGHLETRSAVPNLARLLHGDPVAAVRRTAAWALVQTGDEGAIDELKTKLEKDPDASVREMCAWALGNLEAGRTATSALLAAARRDDDASVRETAVWSIAQHGDESTAKGLGEILESDRNPDVRSTAAWALGQMDLGSAPHGLVTALSDRDPDLRTTAAWALGNVEDRSALPALRTALAKETNDEARKAELRALIHSGEPSERLTELLQSADPEVRKTAIRGIAGDHGLDPWPWPQPRPRPFP